MKFNDYITNDIKEKTEFINSLPTNTLVRKKKVQTTVQEMREAYLGHKDMLTNFINYKYDKIMPTKTAIDIEDKVKELEKIEKLLILGNPNTTFMEKLEFDMLLYDLMHYYNISLTRVNELIQLFINKFTEAGVKLTAMDFGLSYYSYVYMYYFFVDMVNEDKYYQTIFWMNQKVIEYVIMCFRMLLMKHTSKLTNHAKKLYNDALKKYGYKDYEDIKLAYIKIKKEIELAKDEDEYDIIQLCLESAVDIDSLIKGSTIRDSDYEYFIINQIDLDDEKVKDKFIGDLKHLRFNLEEYNAYLVNTELIEYFKTKYGAKISEKANKGKDNALKPILKEITDLIKKINKDSVTMFNKKNMNIEYLDTLKNSEKLFKQHQLLDELYKKYIEYNELYFDSKVESLLKENMSVADVFELYEAFPYFERKTVKKLFDLAEEKEIDERIQIFKDFIYNPNRQVIDMIPLFVSRNIPQQLMNAFRFENLNITEDSFEETNLKVLFEKSERILRGVKVDKFETTIEEIKFLINARFLRNTEESE